MAEAARVPETLPVAALELPLELPSLQLTDPDLGLLSLAFAGSSEHLSTLIDTRDARLLRAGGSLLRERVDGLETWQLRWPDWLGGALLQRDALTGDGAVPPDLLERLVPLTRAGELEELARLWVKRSRWLIRGQASRLAAVLTDETVTLRRGEVTVARYREASVEPVTCTERALAWLCDSLESAGATLLDAPVPLAVRLGAPATGLADLPDPVPVAPNDPVSVAFAAMVRTQARALVAADVRIRAGALDRVLGLRAAGRSVASGLRAFEPLLRPDVAADLIADLDWLDEQAASAGDLHSARARLTGPDGRLGTIDDALAGLESGAYSRFAATLSLPRYRRLLDGLVRFARNPSAALGTDEAAITTAENLDVRTWVRTQLGTGVVRVDKAVAKSLGGATPKEPASVRPVRWPDVVQAVAGVAAVATVGRMFDGKPARVLAKRASRVLRAVDAIEAANRAADELRELALRGSATDPAVVFALGQASAFALTDAAAATVSFGAHWPRRRRRLMRLADRL